MKQPNPKSHFLFRSKWFLVLGLLVTLGFNLSWNPENTQIARYNFKEGKIELAQTSPEQNLREIDLSRFGEDYRNVKVKAVVNRQGSQVYYQLEGNVCSSCVGIQNVSIDEENRGNLEFLQMAIAQHAMKQIEEKNARRTDSPAKPERSSGNSPLESACGMALNDGLISCHKEELLQLVSNCESLPENPSREKSACFSRVNSFFRKYVQRSLGQGLARNRGSEILVEATEARDELINELPSRYDSTIRNTLIGLTSQGVFQRARLSHDQLVLSGFDRMYAAQMALGQMQNEANYLYSGTTGGRLYRVLQAYGARGDGDFFAMNQGFMSSFYNPLNQFFTQATLDPQRNFVTQRGLDFSIQPDFGLGNDILIPGVNGQVGVPTQPGQVLIVQPGAYVPRGNIQQGTLPQAFGVPRAGGVPSGQVQVIIPTQPIQPGLMPVQPGFSPVPQQGGGVYVNPAIQTAPRFRISQ